MPYLPVQPRDIENQIISNSISEISAIQNYTVASGTWEPIFTNVDTKALVLQSRSDNSWMFSIEVSGEPHFTVKNGGIIQGRIVMASGTLLGYVSTFQVSEVFELIQGR